MKNDHQICSCDQKRSTRALTHMHRIRAIRGHLQTGIKRKFIVINFIRGMNGKLAEVIQMCHTFQHWQHQWKIFERSQFFCSLKEGGCANKNNRTTQNPTWKMGAAYNTHTKNPVQHTHTQNKPIIRKLSSKTSFCAASLVILFGWCVLRAYSIR